MPFDAGSIQKIVWLVLLLLFAGGEAVSVDRKSVV